MKLLFLLTIIISCSTSNQITKKNTPEKPKFVYKVKDVSIYNGKIKFVKFDTNLDDGVRDIVCIDKDQTKEAFQGYVKNKVFNLYYAESYFTTKQIKKCYLNQNHVLNIAVKEYNYPREKLNVAKRKVDLNKKDLARVIKEMEIKKTIYKGSSSHFQFMSPFKVPLKTKITSYYGNQRLFNDKKKAQHLGNDFRAAVGVKIPATNRGTVVFTGDLFFSGNMVVIDHGLNIFTVYMHLSKFLVKPGDIVNTGDIVGHAGRTGRVSGPHLHWGVRINGHWVDGFTLVSESKKHFSKSKVN